MRKTMTQYVLKPTIVSDTDPNCLADKVAEVRMNYSQPAAQAYYWSESGIYYAAIEISVVVDVIETKKA